MYKKSPKYLAWDKTRQLIADILYEYGPLTAEEIVQKMKERCVQAPKPEEDKKSGIAADPIDTGKNERQNGQNPDAGLELESNDAEKAESLTIENLQEDLKDLFKKEFVQKFIFNEDDYEVV